MNRNLISDKTDYYCESYYTNNDEYYYLNKNEKKSKGQNQKFSKKFATDYKKEEKNVNDCFN